MKDGVKKNIQTAGYNGARTVNNKLWRKEYIKSYDCQSPATISY